MNYRELTASQVRFSYDLERVKRLRRDCRRAGVIGQPRAMSALRMGMSVGTKGYNIYISGEDGTGRHTAVKTIAQTLEFEKTDVVSAYNFHNPEAPLVFSLPSPQGRELVEFTGTMVENPAAEFPSASPDVRAYLACVRKALKNGDSCASHFKVRLLKDGSSEETVPVVSDLSPSAAGLFGTVSGSPDNYHLNMVAGSVLNVCGGFLVVNMNQVLNQNGLWDAIKLFAESSSFRLSVEDKGKEGSVRPAVSALAVKIILIGSDTLYDKLCETDEQFLRLFKVCAEFDFCMPATDENVGGTIAYLLETAKLGGLKEVTDDALCELLRSSGRYAEMQDELTTKLSFLGDLLHEADYCASEVIDAQAVRKALDERSFANGITESRINREIETGEMIISLEGTKTGVVNGLAVMDRGLVSFGTPAVISVSVAPGSEGIVNIEHEAGLSGEIHDKGLLILEGYLRKQYARNFPLSIYAGICFEQSYAEVDGDSASSSELFALLSAIGELPVRQDIACTGSVNQLGIIQPVGGINEKISGFFDICSMKGLTGHQGVIIPSQNIRSLILPERVVKAVEEKKFHIYPISTIDQGMEILTLRESGERNGKGVFPPDTVNRIIEDRLRRLCTMSQRDK